MNLGRQRAYTGIRSLPIEGNEKEKLLFISDSHRSNGGVPILVRIFIRAYHY